MSLFQQITSKNFQVIYKNAKFKEKLFNYPRYFSSNNSRKQEENNDTNRFVQFQEEVRKRRAEAKKSIIVQVSPEQSFNELYSYCSSFGNIKQMFHYTTGMEPTVIKHFILVEFQQITGAKAALSSATFPEKISICPTKSQFLWFKTGSKKKTEKNNKKLELSVTEALKIPSHDNLRKKLQSCQNVNDQIKTLYTMSKLTDLESRLRFLTAGQLEMALTGMYPTVEVLPFGSSVNGFGKMGCDLDVVLTLDNMKEAPDSRLIFHCKGSAGVDKSMNPRNLETIGDILHLFLPGCTRVRKILQARVPIIKYYHQFTDVECDLSMSNVSGVHMSDMLYIMGALDPRVRPLVFAVRRWAKDVGLTNNTPGRWITNFSLTLLVIAFLQRPLQSPPVLPPLNSLFKSAGSKDSIITDDGVNCSFIRDITKLNHTVSNNESLKSLLCQFFEYYSQFDFKKYSVCLNEAVPLLKPDHSALYIVNPLERQLNVSKNVSLEELDRFKEEVKSAAWVLQSAEDVKTPNWGLLSILGVAEQKSNSKTPKNRKLVSVKDILSDGVDLHVEKHIEFKNATVERQVHNIKKGNIEMMNILKTLKGPIR